MAKKAYIGIDGAAQKVKKGYLGVSNAARKLKKAYVGVGGVARPCWSGGELAYYGTITPASGTDGPFPAATNGKHALIAGTQFVDIYSQELIKSTAPPIYDDIWEGALEYNGAYFVLPGCWNNTTQQPITTVTAYDDDFTRFKPTGLSVARRIRDSSAAIGEYALFAGGANWSGSYDTVDAYDRSLTRTNPTGLSAARHYASGVSMKEYAVFGGGQAGNSSLAVVDAYDHVLTRSSAENLAAARYFLGAAANGESALFAGGNPYTSVVDAYDSVLTHSTVDGLSVARQWIAGVCIEGFHLFCGGYTGSDTLNVTDVYNESLVHTIGPSLSCAKNQSGAISVGNYALIVCGGGFDTVDVYTII